MLSNLRSRFYDTLFEFRHHAYIEMAWYFGMLVIINIAYGLWGSTCIDVKGVSNNIPDSNPHKDACKSINNFLIVFVVLSFADIFISLMLACGLPNIMRGPKWAACGLTNLFLFLLLFLGKCIIVILGVVWIWGQDVKPCQTLVPDLYTDANRYLWACVIVVSLQLLVGTAYLLGFGLQDAVEEGVDQLEQEVLLRQARQQQQQQQRERRD